MKILKCHCGFVEAKINIKNIEKIFKCNCSICKRKGTIMSMVKNEDFKIICSNCGIYTHHNPRSNPAMTGFNLGCIDEVNTFELNKIAIKDGNNHPLDKK